MCGEDPNSTRSPEVKTIGQIQQSDIGDETQSDEDEEWYPGDGICPSTPQFNICYKAHFNNWRMADLTRPESSRSISFYIEAFLNLVKNAPPFFRSPPKGVSITGGARSPLVLRSSLQLETTYDSNCNQRQKSIDYLQCLGLPTPAIYRAKSKRQIFAAIPVTGAPLRSGYFTSIVMAWSYIISCRWVEIFQRASENCQVFHRPDAKPQGTFWHMVTQSRWLARVRNKKGTFYSPWMLRREGFDSKEQYVYLPIVVDSCRLIRLRGDWTPVSPDSALAFNILLDYCTSEGLEGELLLGLASVMMLTSRNTPPPKLPPPLTVFRPPIRYPHKDTIFHELFQSIDKCISLSSTQDALDSLLCSAFFDPSTPCNIVGAASLGIKNALLTPDKVDNQRLLSAITYQKPHLSLLWAAVICNDQATSLLNMALNRLPPLCLVAAFWTNTVQSFVQVPYCLDGTAEPLIPRADEFQASYFCRSHASLPWSPAPPFGKTSIRNLSLEVRAHVSHQHRPRSWMTCWILDSGTKIPASAQHQLSLGQVYSIKYSFVDDGGATQK